MSSLIHKELLPLVERGRMLEQRGWESKGSWFYISKSLLAPDSFPSMGNVWRLSMKPRICLWKYFIIFDFFNFHLGSKQREFWNHLRAKRLVDRVNKPLSYYSSSSMTTDGHLVCIIHIIRYSNYFFLFFYPKQSFHQSRQIDEFDIFGGTIFLNIQHSTVNVSIHTNFSLSFVMIYSIHVPCTFHRIYWMFGYHRIPYKLLLILLSILTPPLSIISMECLLLVDTSSRRRIYLWRLQSNQKSE